jgi:hypothetical protein
VYGARSREKNYCLDVLHRKIDIIFFVGQVAMKKCVIFWQLAIEKCIKVRAKYKEVDADYVTLPVLVEE